MNYTEQQKRKQEILRRIRAQQQIEQQRAKQKEFGLDDIQNLNNYRTGINTASKNTAKLGKTLSNSGNKVVSGIGNKLQTVGKMGQNLTGEAAKQSINNAIKSKLGLGATKAAATGATTGAAAGTAGTTAATTAGTAAGTLGAGTTAATTGATTAGALGAGTTAAGTAGALGTTAGTAGALGASTAAGAAGAGAAGAGAAGAAGAGTAALGALGPVGAALAAGYMIYNMIKSAKKKKAMKQMQVSAQAAEEGTQQAAAKKASAMQNLQTQTPQVQTPQVQTSVPAPEIEQPQVEQVAEQPQEDSSAMDIMQMIPGLSEENADVPNAEAMSADLPDVPQIEPTTLEGAPTGFATDISPEATKALLMERIRAGVGNIGNATQSGLDKLSSGVNDFIAGYKDNAQTSLTEGDLYKRLMPTQDEQTGETQTEDGAYVLSADEKKKSLMNRIGEAVGTGRRIIAHPLTQGTVAGIAYANSEDNPLYGLGKGVEWAQNKAKSDYYQRKIDPNSAPSIMGGYSEKDYNADTLSKYRDTMAENNTMRAELEREKQAAKERNDQAEIQHKKDSLAETKRYHDAQIDRWSKDKGGVDMAIVEEMIRRGYRLEDGVWVK